MERQELKIRNARKEEAVCLAEMERVCFPLEEAASKEEIQDRMDAFLENFFVAEYRGEIIGFINGGTTDRPELPDQFYHDTGLHKLEGAYQTVFGLNVLPLYRRRGVAGVLLEELCRVSRKRGKKGVVLTCKEHLIPFYESHGFQNYGKASSSHGGAVWYDMKRYFAEEEKAE